MNTSRLLVILITSSLLCACSEAKEKLINLTVEYAENPMGIDTAEPRFGWQMAYPKDARDILQTAYQITVIDEDGNTVWESGRTCSDEAQNIIYNGSPLQPATRYNWNVTVWDNKDNVLAADSWFETSLMSTDDKNGWNGAKWIGGGDDDLVLFSQYLPTFKLNLSFRINPKANDKKIGFIYGANDMRLMDANKNLAHISNAKDESYIKVEMDMEPVVKGSNALVNVYRVGYDNNDKADVPIETFIVPTTLINSNNIAADHKLTLHSILGDTRISIGEKEIGRINLNPLGFGGDYIAFPVVGDVGFAAFASTIEDASMEICHFRSPGNLIAKIEANPNALKEKGFYVTDPSRNSMPMLRTTFNIDNKKIKKARLYATARGIYDMEINGHPVVTDYFNPGASQYNKTHFYQIYDVTDILQSGQNGWGALLGEGWWSGAITYSGDNWNYFGDRQSLLAQIIVTYDDGETQIIKTSPEDWKYYSDGPLIYSSLFQGEIYDAGKENSVKGWSTATYDDKDWKTAHEVGLEGNVCKISKHNMPVVDDYSRYHLMSQYGQCVSHIMTLQAKSVEEVRPGVFVYDMGQNMVGVPEITLDDMDEGKSLKMRYAEVKYPNMERYAGNEGMVMMENIRAAMAQDIYTCKGGKEKVSPRFTYHGYRFVEISGLDSPLPLDRVKGKVLSSIDGLKASYESSNEKVNQLWQNIVWSTYGNFLSIPTDCPQRNERMGWAGDISVFSRTASYMAKVPQFLRRYLQAMRDVQRSDGRLPDVAPLGGGFGGLLWGSAGLTVAWESYQQYYDIALLKEHYDAMARYIDFIMSTAIDPETNNIIQEPVFGNLGDWLGPEDMKNDKSLMWESYLIYDLQLMEKFATILNKNDDAAKYQALQQQRVKHFNDAYINSDGITISSGLVNTSKFDMEYCKEAKGGKIDIQTSYILPLAFDIVEKGNRDKFVSNLINSVERENVGDDGRSYPPYSLMTGFIGTAWINPVLSECGHDDVAYNLLQQTSYPSWLYPIEQGATTIWERLNSYTHIDGFGENNHMNSFNHYSFGAVGAWLCAYSLGIKRDEESPGFKHFILCPKIDPTGQMTWAKGHYDSLYGRIESSWKVEGDQIIYDFTIPPNTTASLCLPGQPKQELGSGHHTFTQNKEN